MAIGDHRYSEERWLGVLAKILLDRHRRFELVTDPELAAERWGFCKGGRAFLRLLNVVADRTGEEPMQRVVDQYLDWLQRNPKQSLAISAIAIKLLLRPNIARSLDRAAIKMGYIESSSPA